MFALSGSGSKRPDISIKALQKCDNRKVVIFLTSLPLEKDAKAFLLEANTVLLHCSLNTKKWREQLC